MNAKQKISLVFVILFLTNVSLVARANNLEERGIKPEEAIEFVKEAQQERQMFKPLQVACDNLEDFVNEGFVEAYPDIALKHRQVNKNDMLSFFTEQINLQSAEVDIFELPIGDTTQMVIDNGYYYPLNQAEHICEKVNGYKPFFQKAVMKDTDIAAISRTAEQYTLAYSEYALGQLGLIASDMPSTFMELMDFLLEWDDRVGDVAQQAEITPFGISNAQVKVELLVMVMDQYYALMKQDASAIPRYEADMAELLDKLSLVCSAIPEGTGEQPYIASGERFGHIQLNDQRSYLFNVNGSFHPGRRSLVHYESVSDFVPLALILPSQNAPVLFFEGTLFLVNPYSAQKEQAMQWLTYYMESLPAKDAAAFDRNALPMESELYIAMKEHYTGEIETLKPRIEAAEGAVKSDLEMQLQTKQDKLYSLEQIKWDISTQALEDYAQIFVQNTVLWNDPYKYADSFNPTYRKYLAEGMPGEAVAQAFFAAMR